MVKFLIGYQKKSYNLQNFKISYEDSIMGKTSLIDLENMLRQLWKQ